MRCPVPQFFSSTSLVRNSTSCTSLLYAPLFISFYFYLLIIIFLVTEQLVANLSPDSLDNDLVQHLITDAQYFANPDILLRRLFYVQVLHELGVSLSVLERTRQHIRRLLTLLEQCDANFD